MTKQSHQQRIANAIRRRITGDLGATIGVFSRKRRLTIVIFDGHDGKHGVPRSHVNLDMDAVDKLIRRLSNIRRTSDNLRLRKETP